MAITTPKVTTLAFKVRSYEIGRNRTLMHGIIMNYLEELTVEASTRAGYPNDWYDKSGYLWLIRKWHVRFENPAYYGDNLIGKSWVSDMKRVQSHREYELWRDDTRIVRARANWVFVDRNTGRPARLFDSFEHDYGPMQTTPPDEIITRLPVNAHIATPTFATRTYRAHHFEIDRAHHVNNAHYLRWIEDYILHTITVTDIALDDAHILAHELEYRAAAKVADIIEIQSAIVAIEGNQVLWEHHLQIANNGKRVGDGYSVVSVKNTHNIQKLKKGAVINN